MIMFKGIPVASGTKIIYPVMHFANKGLVVVPPEMLANDKGGYMFRANFGELFTKDAQQLYAVDHDVPGLVCFVDGVPEGTIAFKVVGVTKNKKAVFVRPVDGTQQELFDYYKTREEVFDKLQLKNR